MGESELTLKNHNNLNFYRFYPFLNSNGDCDCGDGGSNGGGVTLPNGGGATLPGVSSNLKIS